MCIIFDEGTWLKIKKLILHDMSPLHYYVDFVKNKVTYFSYNNIIIVIIVFKKNLV